MIIKWIRCIGFWFILKSNNPAAAAALFCSHFTNNRRQLESDQNRNLSLSGVFRSGGLIWVMPIRTKLSRQTCRSLFGLSVSIWPPQTKWRAPVSLGTDTPGLLNLTTRTKDIPSLVASYGLWGPQHNDSHHFSIHWTLPSPLLSCMVLPICSYDWSSKYFHFSVIHV